MRVPEGIEIAITHHHHRVGAFQAFHALPYCILDRTAFTNLFSDNLRDDLGIRRRPEYLPFILELRTEIAIIYQIAVMSNSYDMPTEIENKWLNVFRPVLSGRRIPDMSDPNRPGEGFQDLFRKYFSYQSVSFKLTETEPLNVAIPALSWPRCWSA